MQCLRDQQGQQSPSLEHLKHKHPSKLTDQPIAFPLFTSFIVISQKKSQKDTIECVFFLSLQLTSFLKSNTGTLSFFFLSHFAETKRQEVWGLGLLSLAYFGHHLLSTTVSSRSNTSEDGASPSARGCFWHKSGLWSFSIQGTSAITSVGHHTCRTFQLAATMWSQQTQTENRKFFCLFVLCFWKENLEFLALKPFWHICETSAYPFCTLPLGVGLQGQLLIYTNM